MDLHVFRHAARLFGTVGNGCGNDDHAVEPAGQKRRFVFNEFLAGFERIFFGQQDQAALFLR